MIGCIDFEDYVVDVLYVLRPCSHAQTQTDVEGYGVLGHNVGTIRTTSIMESCVTVLNNSGSSFFSRTTSRLLSTLISKKPLQYNIEWNR